MTCLNGSGVAGLTGGRLFTRTPARTWAVGTRFAGWGRPNDTAPAGIPPKARGLPSVARRQQRRVDELVGRDRLGEQLELVHERDRHLPAVGVDRAEPVLLLERAAPRVDGRGEHGRLARSIRSELRHGLDR